MDERVFIANIERYRALLQPELDDDRQSMVCNLLAEHETEFAWLLQASTSSGISQTSSESNCIL